MIVLTLNVQNSNKSIFTRQLQSFSATTNLPSSVTAPEFTARHHFTSCMALLFKRFVHDIGASSAQNLVAVRRPFIPRKKLRKRLSARHTAAVDNDDEETWAGLS
jgi:hypothetical protein